MVNEKKEKEMNQKPITIGLIIKFILFLISLWLIPQIFFAAGSFGLGYILNFFDSPLVTIICLGSLIIFLPILIGLGKATGETFGAVQATKLFKKNKKDKNKKDS